MSLINNMLRDLDRREANANDQLSNVISAVPVSRRKQLPLRPIVLALTVACVGSGGMWWYVDRASSKPARAPAPLQLSAAGAIPVAPSTAQTATLAAPALPLSPAATAQSAPSADGDSALVPKEASTFEQTVSAAPAFASAARAESVSEPLRKTAASDTTSAAPTKIDVPRHRVMSSTQPRAVEQPHDQTAPADNASVVQTVVEPAATQGASQGATQFATEAATKIRVEAVSSPSDAHDEQVAHALALHGQGERVKPMEMLRALLQLKPDHVGARVALSRIEAEHGRVDDAIQTLRGGMKAPAHAAIVQSLAQLLAQANDWKAASEVLVQAPAELRRDPNFRAFSGAVQQRAGRYEQSIEEYRQALRAAPHIGAWWIGMAISLEGQGRLVEAKEAYAYARNRTALNGTLTQFVDDKLSRLP